MSSSRPCEVREEVRGARVRRGKVLIALSTWAGEMSEEKLR